eukprot:957046-Amphidinium_carterae.1
MVRPKREPCQWTSMNEPAADGPHGFPKLQLGGLRKDYLLHQPTASVNGNEHLLVQQSSLNTVRKSSSSVLTHISSLYSVCNHSCIAIELDSLAHLGMTVSSAA